ncbi:MAG: HDIG domain-containing metalloprotein [Terracidiphilus sp.]|jgi:putative nucleotidyltransferase with HDIG domain
MLNDRKSAFALLKELGASSRLLHHAQVVAQAADRLLSEFQALGLICDARAVELGAVLHDIGKIKHPKEFSEPGSLHEQAGQALLLSHGVQPAVARCCASHGAWQLPDLSFEERVVALADKLWKGKREAELELGIIDEIAARVGVARWDIFERLDNTFEEIAAGGEERLQRSMLK